MSEFLGGIEGGASHSTAVILTPWGKVVATVKGPSTALPLIGLEECCKRIATLIGKAKSEVGVSEGEPIRALGLALSGCESPISNQKLVEELKARYPKLALSYVVGSDSEGAIAAVSRRGGVVCISGTGSSTILVNPNGQKLQCGGWGHILGDEASAWGISYTAIKSCLDDIDNFQKVPYSTERIWKLVKSFFMVETPREIINSFYGNFDKARVAGLCKKLADLARNEHDELAKYVFHKAGADLAKSVEAVAARAGEDLEADGGLRVICVGSVWLSWDLLREGFQAWLEDHSQLANVILLKLKTEGAVGAALMAADKLQLDLQVDREYSSEAFAVFNKQGLKH